MNENLETTTTHEAVEPTRSRRTRAPRADIFESADRVTLVADMPGVAPEDLNVTLENNELRLFGRVKSPAEADLEGYSLRYAEIESVDFERTFALSGRVDVDAITATMKDGLLHLVVPKLQPAQKEIPVQTT